MDNSKVVRVEEEKVTPKTGKVEINAQTPHVLVCVYGTLRTGQGNWRWALKDKAECLGTFKSEPNFTMYGRRAGFPSLVAKGDTSIEYEVFKVTDQKVLGDLHGLEGCSGIPGDPANRFYDIMPMKTPVGDGWIYVRNNNYEGNEDSIIKTGNWLHKSV